MLWKVTSMVVGVAAGKAATAISHRGWKAATGKRPPVGNHDPAFSAKEAALFAIVSAAVAQGIRAFADRKAADYYVRSTGHQPKVALKERQKAEQQALKAKNA